MKEQIYTIPLNEAFEENCECAMCFIHSKLENDAVEYALGPAMMEPDYRIISNEKGYCNKHYGMMFSKSNKLSLGLTLDTHLLEFNKLIATLTKNASGLEKNGIFKKNSRNSFNKISEILISKEKSCVICEKIDNTINRYVEVFFYLWKNENEFREKVLASKGFCIPHLRMLCEYSFKYLSDVKASEFIKLIFEKEQNEFLRLQEEIHKFTLKFDYRNKEMEWGTSQDSPVRTIEKLSGYINTFKDE